MGLHAAARVPYRRGMGLFGGMSEEELRTSGTATTARVVYVDDTGKRRENDTEAKVKIQLKIDSGSARGRELDKAKWVPVTKMPHVGETVQIRFDPDHVEDWAWGDSSMYEPARASVQPAAHAAPGAPPSPAGTPAPGDPMVEFIQHAAGPWGQMPGFKQMIEGAMSANLQAMQSMGIDMSQVDAGGVPVYVPNSASQAAPRPGGSADDTAARLKRLDQLREQGLVTAEEHAELRKKIIDSI
jgi:hypothetical protein